MDRAEISILKPMQWKDYLVIWRCYMQIWNGCGELVEAGARSCLGCTGWELADGFAVAKTPYNFVHDKRSMNYELRVYCNRMVNGDGVCCSVRLCYRVL